MLKIRNIPAGVPFADALAGELLRSTSGKPDDLARIRILLPTRRACRTLQESFLRLSEGKPLLLPRLQPLGDVDEQELSLATFEGGVVSGIPPAMPALQRQALLGRMVLKANDFSGSPAHAVSLAAALGRLLDRIHTEGLDPAMLRDLAPEEFAAHWQITLKLLDTILTHWPLVLEERGMVDAADRRNRLLVALADHWERSPPATPVIAAGSTGSIPATARLLTTVAGLPQGCVVLPGLDTVMDEESWICLDDTHPQATLKSLLAGMGVERGGVEPWPGTEGVSPPRATLIRETMRPAPTSGRWSEGALRTAEFSGGLEGLRRIDAATPEEEARVVALMLRETLETPGMTAALVTPDRTLARRVAASCRRWGIEIDDSGGRKLRDTPAGVFLLLVMKAALSRFAPGDLLSLLRHRNFRPPEGDHGEARRLNGLLETTLLRGAKPPPGFEGLRNRLAEKGDVPEIRAFINALERAFGDLALTDDSAPFVGRIVSHVRAAENLAGGPDNLWTGEDGEAAALLLSELRACAGDLPDVTGSDYLAVLGEFMETVTVRPAYGAHPRLSILGQLEARMARADLIVMAGLNEGTWPPDPGYDPWMSRPMAAQYGLPSPERSVGLSAHDFAQGFCAPRVALTRSIRADGAPTVPSRWLQRLDIVLQSAGIDASVTVAAGGRVLGIARSMDHAAQIRPVSRPAPVPPLAMRPRRLPVTQIDTWMRDPYGIYARYVLKLEKLDPPEQPPDAAARGRILHKALESFIHATKEEIPADAVRILLDKGHDLIARRADDPGFWEFWWPRFERLAAWIVDHERGWRERASPVRQEAEGSIVMDGPAGSFTLTARADRIDRLHEGGGAIIDYKSGGSHAVKRILSGDAPQLALEGLILREGGFTEVSPLDPHYLGIWSLTGGREAGEITAVEEGVAEAVESARTGLESLIALFDDPATPYYSLPDPDRAPRFSDYDHLARVQEWAALDEAGEGE